MSSVVRTTTAITNQRETRARIPEKMPMGRPMIHRQKAGDDRRALRRNIVMKRTTTLSNGGLSRIPPL